MSKHTEEHKQTISDRVAGFITGKPFWSLGIAILLIGLFIPGLKLLKADFSYRIWFNETDPLLKEYDAFERRFGNDESIAVLVHSPSGVFDKETVAIVQELTREMWLVPEIIRVDSLSNYNWTHAEGDDILVDPLLPDDEELSDAMLAERKKVAMSHEVIPDYLVSRDGKTAMLYAAIKPSFETSPNYELIINGSHKGDVQKEGVRDKVKKFKGKGDHSFYITGSGAVSDAFREATQKDMSILVPMLLGIIVIFIIGILRRFSALVLSFTVIILTIMFTFGFSGIIGIKFNNIIAILPNTLIAICIADAIHILVTYLLFRRDGIEHKESVYQTLTKNLQPTFLTSISTAIGFFSFFSAKVVPIGEMGYLAAAGVMGAWVVTIFIVGPLLSLIPIKVKKSNKIKEETNGNINEPKPWAWAFSGWIAKWKKPIIAVFVILTVSSVYIGLQNEVNSDPFKYFPEGFPLRTANDFMIDNVGGASGLELGIDSGKPDGIKEPEFLRRVEKFQAWLDEFPKVTKTISIIDILKQTNRSLHGDQQEYYRLPDTKEATAQQLFLYTMSLPQGMDLNDRMTIGNDALRMTVRWTLFKSTESTKAFKVIREKGSEMGFNVTLTGKMPLYQSMNKYVVSSFIQSLSFAIFFIGFLMVITFRSLKTGLMAMVPNIIPLLMGAALMTILAKPLDIGTVIVASICLGIAVDDSIHFLTNYYKWRKKEYSHRKAIAMVLSYTGPALFVTTLILVVGFGTFMFASFVPNINFGILTALILTVALVTDLVLLPAILLLKAEKETERENEMSNREYEGGLLMEEGELAPVTVNS
ncbi:MAG: MMPL family transporter [bacterium]|nr:MMPL family transporter [bacterium]